MKTTDQLAQAAFGAYVKVREYDEDFPRVWGVLSAVEKEAWRAVARNVVAEVAADITPGQVALNDTSERQTIQPFTGDPLPLLGERTPEQFPLLATPASVGGVMLPVVDLPLDQYSGRC